MIHLRSAVVAIALLTSAQAHGQNHVHRHSPHPSHGITVGGYGAMHYDSRHRGTGRYGSRYHGSAHYGPYRYGDGIGYPYYGFDYVNDPYRSGHFEAPDLLDDPYFRAQHKYDSHFPGRYGRRPPLQLRGHVAPPTRYRSSRR